MVQSYERFDFKICILIVFTSTIEILTLLTCFPSPKMYRIFVKNIKLLYNNFYDK